MRTHVIEKGQPRATRAARSATLVRWAVRLVLPAAILVGWELVYRASVFPPVLFPAPMTIWRSGIHLLDSGQLLANVLISWRREFLGFLLAAAVALPLGIATGWIPIVDDLTDVVLNAVRQIPPYATIPLAILWLGVGEALTRWVVVYAAFFPILVNSAVGVRSVDKALIRAALTLGAKRGFLLRKVVIPAALPSMMTGLRLGLGLSWAAIVTAELFGAQSGIGFMIQYYSQLFDSSVVILGIVTIGMLGYVTDRAFRHVERKALPWREGLVVDRR